LVISYRSRLPTRAFFFFFDVGYFPPNTPPPIE
jgi:hypothetical protein